MAIEPAGIEVLGELSETETTPSIPWQETLIALPFLIGIVALIVSGVWMFEIEELLKVVLGVIGLIWMMFVIVEELKPKTD